MTRQLLFCITAPAMLPVLATPALAADAAEATSAEDILVTAQRREQLLVEVPQSLSVIGAQALERQQATSFIDFASMVPGFSLTRTNPGKTFVDTVGRTESGADDNESHSGRASLLFHSTETFSIRLAAQLQNIRVDSPSSLWPMC